PHHPQYHGSRAALRPHPGDDLPPGPAQARGRHRPAAPAHLRNRVQRGVRALCRADLERPARGGEQGPARRRGGEAATGCVVSATATLAKHRGFPPPLVLGSFAGVIVLVEVLIRAGLINRFIVPMPSEIIMAFPRIVLEEHVLTRFVDTAIEAFSASVLVTIFGIDGGVLLYQFRLLR